MGIRDKNKGVKILVVSNGGISEEGHKSYTAEDTGSFLSSLNNNGFIITCADSRGNSKNNKFIYTYDLNQRNINYFIIAGGRRNPLYYAGLIKLAYHIAVNNFVYLYYPGGVSKITARLCKLSGKKYGVFVRGYGLYIPDAERRSKPENTFSDSFILENASFLITVSPGMQSELLALNANVDITNNIIWDLDNLTIRQNKDYRVARWRFLFVGSITEMKGILDLIDAVRIINQKKINCRLILVGDGNLLKDLINKQHKKEIPDNIEFMGSIQDKTKLEEEYHNADAFIFPSRTEGFPRVLYEAMLKGLPIFTTMAGGINGLMKPGYNCIELPIRDPHGQAEAVISGIKDPDLMKRIAENGQETIKSVLINKKLHHEVLENKINEIILKK